MVFQIYRVVHILLTGAVTILISTFIASGGLGENYTDNPFPNWGIGGVLSFIKKTVIYGLIISFLPILFYMVLFYI
ncbi:hypothetical protein ON064_01430 [Planococcus sp. A6]|uniref:hypothetical protein n=1 Tax=Planococcus sp. A6 TaxID=2992760 RepID=UPI00237B8FFE|nr:hypothetical protein [Planococcus sp. A6]MDE0581709.1 hypothetical protein [Planococcus sp. A6]